MIRRHAATFAIAAVTAAVMAGVPALASLHRTAASTSIPVVKSAFRNGPFAIPDSNSPGQVAHLSLPAGKWAVVAKLYIRNSGSNAGPVECRLATGADFDKSRADLESNAGGAHTDTLALNIVHRFTSPGAAKLKCTDFATADGEGNFARITAIKAGTLTNTAVSG